MRPIGPSCDGLRHLMAELPPCFTMVEVGVYAGASTAIFAEWAKRIYAVDPWLDYQDGNFHMVKMVEHEKTFNILCEKLNKVVIKMKMTSEEAAGIFKDGLFDLVYVDGDHSYEAVKKDIALWLPKVKCGGYLAGHDFDAVHPDVQRAVQERFGRIDRTFCDASWAHIKTLKDAYGK